MKKESEVDEFGRKLHEKFMDNRKSFWKEIERGGGRRCRGCEFENEKGGWNSC